VAAEPNFFEIERLHPAKREPGGTSAKRKNEVDFDLFSWGNNSVGNRKEERNKRKKGD